MLKAISVRNFARWHVLQGELQDNNLMTNLPNILSISPSNGPKAGVQSITITGTDFVPDMGVEIGGNQPININIVSTNTLTALTPGSSTSGPVDVTVIMRNPDAGSTTFPNAYTYVDAPDVISLSPATGPKTGGQQVTIVGANFVSGMSVKFGDEPATVVIVASSTQLSVQTPHNSNDGAVDVTVETAGGSATLAQGYVYAN
jgi:hypothetical protein